MNTVDEVLKEGFINIQDAKKIVEANYSDTQVKRIMENIIQGEVRRHLADEVNNLMHENLESRVTAILDNFMAQEDFISTILFSAKKYVYSSEFSEDVQSLIKDRIEDCFLKPEADY